MFFCFIFCLLRYRERNREHAKKSRIRKKFFLESLQKSVDEFQAENDRLRAAIREHLPEEADTLLDSCLTADSGLCSFQDGATELAGYDFCLVKALQTSRQNFTISDPTTPDNPIVFASQGFLDITQYTLAEVMGRNCRFLQGPETSAEAIATIREGIRREEEVTVLLLNYRKDGTTFWNKLFVSPLRDAQGKVVNYLGVQCEVGEAYVKAFRLHSERSEKLGA